LKNAVKGKYRVSVNYRGATRRFSLEDGREITADGPAAVMAEIYTKYAGKAEQRRVVCLQMPKVKILDINGKDKPVEVAEFEF
jgi:hypothetical protein